MEIRGHIVDVLDRRIYDGAIKVEEGIIKCMKPCEVTADAPYILPGFIDAHIHIESTLLMPENYARVAASKGVLAVVADPHEIANVSGLAGIKFMIENGKKVNFHFNFCAPSCVPCTGFETSGATIDHNDIASLLESEDICALAEFMNAFGVITADKECMAKLEAAKKAGKPIDGHAPGLTGQDLTRYAAEGISTDHECVSMEEALERTRAGMKVLIREGSASCDFEALSPLLADHSNELMFCSDDKYPDELMEGYIDDMVRRSVAKAYPLWNVLNAACVTPVKHYNLKHGLLKQGQGADFILVDNLKDFNVLMTYINGDKVFSNDGVKTIECPEPGSSGRFPNTFNAERISVEDIRVPIENKVEVTGIKVIVADDLSIRTGMMVARPKVENGLIVSDIENDILKMVVYSRYGNGKPQTAFIHGFKLKAGAMASTIAHDSHNIVAVGTNDNDIENAVNRLIELNGGMIVCNGNESAELALPVAGLMSDLGCETVAKKYRIIKERARALGCGFSAAFMTLSFMCLPVIPVLKLTDKGLFNANEFAFTELFEYDGTE